MTSKYAELDVPTAIQELSNSSNRPIVDPSLCLISISAAAMLGSLRDTTEAFFLSQSDGSLAVYGLTEPPQRAVFIGTIPATEWAARGK